MSLAVTLEVTGSLIKIPEFGKSDFCTLTCYIYQFIVLDFGFDFLFFEFVGELSYLVAIFMVSMESFCVWNISL